MPQLGVSTVLITDFDLATNLVSLAVKHVVDYMKARGIKVDVLYGDNAIRSKAIESIEKNDPIFFFGMGHGSIVYFTGQGFNYVFWSCDCKELKGRVVFLLSCNTGADLGADIVNKGGLCFIGYKREFVWIQEKTQNPLNDRYGRGFFESALEIVYRLASGDTTGKAFKASIDRWNYWIDYWTRSDDPVAPLVIALMINDRDCQVIYGDENAKIIEVPMPEIQWYVLSALFASIPLITVGGAIMSNEMKKVIV